MQNCVGWSELQRLCPVNLLLVYLSRLYAVIRTSEELSKDSLKPVMMNV